MYLAAWFHLIAFVFILSLLISLAISRYPCLPGLFLTLICQEFCLFWHSSGPLSPALLSFFSSLSRAFAWGYQASNRWMEPEGVKAFWFWEWCRMGLGHISFCLQHHFTTLHCTWQIDWQICLSNSYWWMFVLRHAGEDGFAQTSIAQMGLQRRCTLSTHWWVASKLFHGISNPLGGFDLPIVSCGCHHHFGFVSITLLLYCAFLLRMSVNSIKYILLWAGMQNVKWVIVQLVLSTHPHDMCTVSMPWWVNDYLWLHLFCGCMSDVSTVCP